MVVDADEGHLVAHAAFLLASISMDPVSDAIDAGETLRIDVEQLFRKLVLVTLRRIEGLLESPQSAEKL